MSDDVIVARNVCKTYPGVQALEHFDFTLRRRELHCLVGENGSGKSTLIKILSGVEAPEPGADIAIHGKTFQNYNAHIAIEQGIRVIYQDLSLFPNLAVHENIAFQLYGKRHFASHTRTRAAAQQALDEIGLKIDLERRVGTLSIAEQQLVEITRALIGNLTLLILDEPTASLTRREVNALFRVIERLQAKGVTTLFVSHKLNEIFDIAERVTVLRDGKKIGSYRPDELNHERLTYLMTGRKVSHTPPPPLAEEQPLLQIKSLCKAGNYRDITLSLFRGEVLGITGLLGSGRSELARSIFGMNRPDSGTIWLEGKPLYVGSNTRARKVGIGYVPENRLVEGVVMDQSIEDNITMTLWEQLTDRLGTIDRQHQHSEAQQWVNQLDIKTAGLAASVQTLSGGNQQKVVLAKWLATKPKILLLDEPTVGIDVFAKDSVHRLIQSLAEQGLGIILISDEIQEVLGNCHRVLVMQRGRIVHELRPDSSSEAELLQRFNLS